MADKLVETGWAYPCFCTEEELIAKREQVRYVSKYWSAAPLHMQGGVARGLLHSLPHTAVLRLGLCDHSHG